MNAPALIVAIPILLGVLCGAAALVTPLVAAEATLVACAGAALALWGGRRWAFVVAACVGFMAAGASLGGSAQRTASHPSLLDWYDADGETGPARLRGVLRADAAPGASSVGLVLDVVQANERPVRGGVRVSVAGALAASAAGEWRAGRTISVQSSLHTPLDYRDPGVPSDRERLAGQGIVLLGSVKSAALVTDVTRGTRLAEAAAALRARIRTASTRTVGQWSPSSSAVVTAILIGDRNALDPEDERRLQEAGTYHVIAISGGNIALLTGLLLLCGRAARLPPRATAFASIALLGFYGYAAGLAPSVMRATIAGILFLAGRASDHRGAILNAVAVAAAFAAIVDPLTLLDPGFALSFGATFAIIVAASRVQLRPETPTKPPTRTRWRTILHTRLSAAAMLGAATICAELALAPIGARVFNRLSLAGLVLNFAAIPLMSVIQVAGMAAVALDVLSTTLAAGAGGIAHIATVALLTSARLVDVAPWLVLDLPPPGWSIVAGWYAGWGGLLFARRRSHRAAAAVVALTATALMIAAPRALRATNITAAPPGWMRVVFIDVGQGDATLVLLPGMDPMLIDAGGVPGTTFDLGRRVTLPAVWAFGARRLQALVLTHGDPDHIGGAPAILRALSPREIWDGVPVPAHEPLQRLHELAARARIRWIERRTGETFNAGTSIRVLNPPPPTWQRRRVRNDDSVVLEFRLGDVAFVLPGDITAAVEPEVAAAFADAPFVITKAPHHGSAGSSSAALVAALHPGAVVFSAGARNPFGHPAPLVVDRYRTAGATLFSTADDGAIVIDTDGQHVVAWCPASGRRVVLR